MIMKRNHDNNVNTVENEILILNNINNASNNTNGIELNRKSIHATTSSCNHEPLTLTWENVTVTAQKSKYLFFADCNSNSSQLASKDIVKNVTGIAKPTEILAILGASGSGKTTLLNTLNMRNIGSLKVDGLIKVNGERVNSIEQISSISGYVQQNDLFIGTLTVKEHLIFNAMLRMDKKTSFHDRLKRVDKVIQDFNLKKSESLVIGTPELGDKCLSGGERRRLSFASEILTDPPILFCDEPTTGLDSFMAYSIVDCMKQLAAKGKTIIFTIHQPSGELFEIFDKVCLIAEGRLAYLGDRQNAYEFFDSQGYKCPAKYNIAEYFIKILSISPLKRDEDIQKVEKIASNFENSHYLTEIKSEISRVNSEHQHGQSPHKDLKLYKTNIFNQFYWLSWRNFIATKRDSAHTKVLFIQAILIGIMYGLIFFQLSNDQEGIQNVNALIFLSVVYSSVIYLFTEVKTFPLEIEIFMREHQNGMYRVVAYYISKSLAELPSHFFFPLIFTGIFYWMANLSGDFFKFASFSFLIILTAQASISFGHFLSAVSPTVSVASLLAGPVLGPLMIFSGHLLNNSTTPVYFLWLKYLSWLSYANEGILISQWKDVEHIDCSKNMVRCLPSGQNVLDYLHIDKNHFFYTIYMEFFIIFGWRIMAFLVLLIKSYSR